MAHLFGPSPAKSTSVHPSLEANPIRTLYTYVLILLFAASAAAQCRSPPPSAEDVAALSAVRKEINSTGYTPQWWQGGAEVMCCWEGVYCTVFEGKKRVVNLKLTQARVFGPLPPSVGNLTALTFLQLSKNNFSGTIPDTWRRLTRLTFIDLSAAEPSDDEMYYPPWITLPKTRGFLSGTLDILTELPKLLRLNVQGQKFSGKMNELKLQNLKSLEWLVLGDNSFIGTFPKTLKFLKNLTVVHLASNPLSPSSLPSDAASWPVGLNFVNLSSLNLVGSIPSELKDLEDLAVLDLSNNKLGQKIPDFGRLGDKLFHPILDLSHNKLIGPIPSSLDLAFPAKLDLSHNRLTGNLPTQLPGVVTLDVSYNNFTGTVPEDLLQYCLDNAFYRNPYLNSRSCNPKGRHPPGVGKHPPGVGKHPPGVGKHLRGP